LTEETSIMLDIGKPHNLSMTAVQHTCSDDPNVGPVKEELSDSTDYFGDFDEGSRKSVKNEVTSSAKRHLRNSETKKTITTVLRIDLMEVKTESNEISPKNEESAVQTPSDKTHKNNKNGAEENAAMNKETLAPDGTNSDYFCPTCNKKHVTKKALDQHIKVHDISRSYVCEICEYRFNTKANLKTHKENIHRTKSETVACTVCYKLMNSPQILKRHMKIHTEKPPKIHACDRPYACDMCPKTYAKRQALKVHVRSHTGERPFNCDKCSKTFTRYEILKRHLKTHFGEN
ncbi:Uncharacterized protein OBRU01_01242, partial [Operophtera brumata]